MSLSLSSMLNAFVCLSCLIFLMHGLCKISQLIADSVWCLSKHACTVRYMFKKDVQIKDFNFYYPCKYKPALIARVFLLTSRILLCGC